MSDLPTRMHALACEVDDEPADTFATDPGRAALTYLAEALDAAQRGAEPPRLASWADMATADARGS